jgi:hypothetical protein
LLLVSRHSVVVAIHHLVTRHRVFHRDHRRVSIRVHHRESNWGRLHRVNWVLRV